MTYAYIQVGVLFFILASIVPLGKGRRAGKWVGIRTPVTLSSRDVWNRVHGIGWIPMFLAGLIVFAGLFLVSIFGLQDDVMICIGVVVGSFIAGGVVLNLIINQVARDFGVEESPKDEARFEKIMAANVKGIRIAGYFTGAVLVVLGLLLPFIASYGPDSIIGIRTQVTQNSERIWEIVHMRAILPTLVGGFAIALMSYLIRMLPVRPSWKLWTWVLLYFTILGFTAKYAIWW